MKFTALRAVVFSQISIMPTYCVCIACRENNHQLLSTPVNYSSSTDDSNDEPVATGKERRRTKKEETKRVQGSISTQSGWCNIVFHAWKMIPRKLNCTLEVTT